MPRMRRDCQLLREQSRAGKIMDGFLTNMTKHDYIKKFYFLEGDGREQTRWNLSDVDDAATLLLELQELEWRYHHLAMLKYRNHRHKEFHHNFGMYWGIKTVINVIFPWLHNKDTFSRVLQGLDKEIEKEDSEMMKRFV